MPISDSFKQHGYSAVKYNPETIIRVAQAVIEMLRQRGERHVTVLCVAALLIQTQSAASGDTIENTIELMRRFMADMQRGQSPKA